MIPLCAANAFQMLVAARPGVMTGKYAQARRRHPAAARLARNGRMDGR